MSDDSMINPELVIDHKFPEVSKNSPLFPSAISYFKSLMIIRYRDHAMLQKIHF